MRFRFSYCLLVIFILMGCSKGPDLLPTQTASLTLEPLATVTDTQETEISDIHPGLAYYNLEFDGKKRFYMVYIPEGYSTSDTYPLVIYLHSYGWGAQRGMDYTRLDQLADTYGFMIAYPSARPNWNSGIGDNPDWGTPDNDDAGLIGAMIDEINQAYGMDERRIYATGYSNGGFMAYLLACQLGHRIAAVASVSGVLSISSLNECDPAHAMPIIQIHGTNDKFVPIDGASGWLSVEDTMNFWTIENKCTDKDLEVLDDIDPTDDSTVEIISYTNCTDNSNIIYYKVINGGHTWPGADPPGYRAGNTNLDIDASFLIWDFFKDFQLAQHN